MVCQMERRRSSPSMRKALVRAAHAAPCAASKSGARQNRGAEVQAVETTSDGAPPRVVLLVVDVAPQHARMENSAIGLPSMPRAALPLITARCVSRSESQWTVVSVARPGARAVTGVENGTAKYPVPFVARNSTTLLKSPTAHYPRLPARHSA